MSPFATPSTIDCKQFSKARRSKYYKIIKTRDNRTAVDVEPQPNNEQNASQPRKTKKNINRKKNKKTNKKKKKKKREEEEEGTKKIKKNKKNNKNSRQSTHY